MKRSKTLIATCLLGIMTFIAPPIAADWVLDGKQSFVSFTSVKNAAVVEPHYFKSLSGSVTKNGQATLKIDLDSVETLIPIRNERMAKMLFDTEQYPTARIKIDLPPERLAELAGSNGETIKVAGTLQIKDQVKKIAASLVVAGTQDGGVLVSSTQPILIYASQWKLTSGIDALKKIAGLTSIATSVPVNLTLKFVPQSHEKAPSSQAK